jgi:hypothetical protein
VRNEVNALLSGVTTIQGTSPGSQCIRTLIRNAENQANLPVSASHIRTYILDISSFQGGIDWNATKSYSLAASGNDAFFRQTRSPRWPAGFGCNGGETPGFATRQSRQSPSLADGSAHA